MPVQTPRAVHEEPRSQGAQHTDRSAYRRLASDRTTLISYLLKLTRCVDGGHADLAHAVARRFTDLMIDYLSLGQFRVLNYRHAEPHQTAALNYFTTLALRFTEKYAADPDFKLDSIKPDLESLAFALEVRFEIEDELVYTHPT